MLFVRYLIPMARVLRQAQCCFLLLQVHIALAEVQSGLAEALFLARDSSANRLEGFNRADSSAATWQEAAAAALVASDAALNIDRGHVNAHVVRAEVHALHAKLLQCFESTTSQAKGSSLGAQTSDSGTGNSGISEMCRRHWQSCIECYEKVLTAPQKLGSCSERCTVRYNYACALAMHGRTQEAVAMLQKIAQKHPESLVGAHADSQLAVLWHLQEFKALIVP